MAGKSYQLKVLVHKMMEWKVVILLPFMTSPFSLRPSCSLPLGVATKPMKATKYMANSPAKNMSSLDSQTMVPTDTMFGLFSECTRWVIAVPEFAAAVVTSSSMTCEEPEGAPGSAPGRVA